MIPINSDIPLYGVVGGMEVGIIIYEIEINRIIEGWHQTQL